MQELLHKSLRSPSHYITHSHSHEPITAGKSTQSCDADQNIPKLIISISHEWNSSIEIIHIYSKIEDLDHIKYLAASFHWLRVIFTQNVDFIGFILAMWDWECPLIIILCCISGNEPASFVPVWFCVLLVFSLCQLHLDDNMLILRELGLKTCLNGHRTLQKPQDTIRETFHSGWKWLSGWQVKLSAQTAKLFY